MSINRRNLLQSSLAAGALATGVAATASRSQAEDKSKSIAEGSTILFQGDSITDARRQKDPKSSGANNPGGLGNGYPFMIAHSLLREHPNLKLKIFNRGISGHKVPDLAKRWQADCIDLKPDILSILIGVNDIWHKLNGRYDGTVEVYKSGFTQLIEQTKEKLPDVRIVMCEPFVLKCGAVNDSWFPEFDHRRESAIEVAKSFALEVVPFQMMFNKALAEAPANYWAGDGVHPSLAGHSLMAEKWREVVGV